MSIAIDPEKVTRALVGHTWFEVEPGSFYCDSYEIIEQPSGLIYLGGGQSGICATGFCFQIREQTSRVIAGPMTSLDALEFTR